MTNYRLREMVRARARATRWRSIAAALVWLLCLALGAVSDVSVAGQERYDYDALGRLVRVIDDQGRVTDYVYDAVGNILEVRKGGVAQPPSVTSVTPIALRRGGRVDVTVLGANLANVELSAIDPELAISGVTASSTQLSFNLVASDIAALGPSQLVLRNAAGQTATTISVQPKLPTLGVVPTPLAIPPDGVPHGFSIALDHADVVDHTISVTTDHPGIAAVIPTSATIAAGQTGAVFQITGQSAGQTVIRVTSPGMTDAGVPVFVTADFRGINTAYAPVVGVSLAAPPGQTSSLTALYSPLIGVGFGSLWVDSSPSGFALGASGVLTLTGSGLPADLAVSVFPSDGISFGVPAVAVDGRQATVAVSIAPNAGIGLRELRVTGGGQRLLPARVAADRLNVLHLQPVVESVDPIFGTAGTTISPFIIRGRNLFDLQSIAFAGGGILTGAQPQVSADGTQVSTAVQISPVAAAGTRTVTVTTPAGTSAAGASSANTFSVVTGVGDTYANVVAPPVGVEFAATVPATSQSIGLVSSMVGVSLGPVVNAIQPATGATGQSLTLVLQGRELNNVTGISLVPQDGVTVGAPVASVDGASASVSISIAADAPLGLRRLLVSAGGTGVSFAATDGDRFNVTAPVPELASVEPIVVQTGATVGFVLRGRNFQNASAVRFAPPDGIAVGTLGVSSAGDTISVLATIDASAATGSRVVSVVTPAGQTSAASGPTNTVAISANAGTTYGNILAPAVGVEFASTSQPTTATIPVFSPSVGVELATTTQPLSSTYALFSPQLGVVLGATVLSAEPSGLNAGESTTLTLRGVRLPADATVSLTPSIGLTIGAPAVAPDGTSLSVSLAAAADAPKGPRIVQVQASGVQTPFADPSRSQLSIAAGPPEVVSLSPILARQGETVALTIRGVNLDDVIAIAAEPSAGLTFGTLPIVAANGGQIDVGLAVAADAPLGGRVIRVTTRSGTTTAIASPANTFTVYPP